MGFLLSRSTTYTPARRPREPTRSCAVRLSVTERSAAVFPFITTLHCCGQRLPAHPARPSTPNGSLNVIVTDETHWRFQSAEIARLANLSEWASANERERRWVPVLLQHSPGHPKKEGCATYGSLFVSTAIRSPFYWECQQAPGEGSRPWQRKRTRTL